MSVIAVQYALSTLLLLLVALAVRLHSILPDRNAQKARSTKTRNSHSRKLAVFLGSGGHTSEALTMVSALDFHRYSPRTYIVSEGDSLSAQKAVALESEKTRSDNAPGDVGQFTVLTVPRARRVHQPLFTTPPTALVSLATCLYHVTLAPIISGSRFADVLILNGPGTCLILCVAVYCNKILGLPAPRLIYIESFARVKSLSLSGKLLRPLVDRFVVQWPQLLRDRGHGECHGWLV